MFYLYVIIDPQTGNPIYVGKGSGDRLYQHWFSLVELQHKGCNPELRETLNKIAMAGYNSPIYEKWVQSSDEDFIFWMEIVVIDFLGRETLCNRNNGGRWKQGKTRLKQKRRALQAHYEELNQMYEEAKLYELEAVAEQT